MSTGMILSTMISFLLGGGEPARNHHDGNAVETPKATEVLLVGVFHFNNPGRDMVKTKSFDVLTEAAQADLEEVASRIAAFGPSKIFVEFDYDKQEKLDAWYDRYLGDDYFGDPTLSDYRRKSEVVQLGFRVAKKLGHKKLYAVDYMNTESPFGEVMQAIEDAGQDDLTAKIHALMQESAADMNRRIDSGASLKDLLLWQNTRESRDDDAAVYTELFTRAGGRSNFAGAHLVSEWYRRNIYIWSLIQKQTTKSDERIMVMFGAGHIALLEQILSSNRNWNTVGLNEIMER